VVRSFQPSIDVGHFALSLVSQFGEIKQWVSHNTSAYEATRALYAVPTASPVAVLDCETAFAGLSNDEKM
jgi:hypothetical protein